MKVRGGRARALMAGGVALLLAGAPACTDNRAVPLPQSATSQSPGSAASPVGGPSPTAARVPNDLRRMPLKRALNVGSLTVSVQYSSTLPIRSWQTGVAKPLLVSVSAINRRREGQKIYLSKVTMSATGYDSGGRVLEAPRSLTDAANISPGFIVTFPDTYNQSFALPAVDESTTRLTVDITYELVLQASKDKDGRNFSKQVATDSVTVPIAR